MTRFSDIPLHLFEKSLNRALSFSPTVKEELAELAGQIIQFDITAPPFNFYFIPNEAGELQVYSNYDTFDVRISGSIIAFIKNMLIGESSQQFFSGELKITGETAIAHQFGAILSKIDIDWEEQFSRLVGDQIAYQSGKRIKQFKHYAKQSLHTLGLNSQEYLTEEARLLPTCYELTEFYKTVDTIRDDTERLAAKLHFLKQQIETIKS